MLSKSYVALAVFLLGLFAYSWIAGTRIIDLDGAARSRPKGPGQYHK